MSGVSNVWAPNVPDRQFSRAPIVPTAKCPGAKCPGCQLSRAPIVRAPNVQSAKCRAPNVRARVGGRHLSPFPFYAIWQKLACLRNFQERRSFPWPLVDYDWQSYFSSLRMRLRHHTTAFSSSCKNRKRPRFCRFCKKYFRESVVTQWAILVFVPHYGNR